MDAPKCKICDTRHWGSACYRPPSRAELERMAQPTPPAPKREKKAKAAPKPKPAKAAAAKKPGRPKVVEDRKAHLAELARKRRADKKAAAQS